MALGCFQGCVKTFFSCTTAAVQPRQNINLKVEPLKIILTQPWEQPNATPCMAFDLAPYSRFTLVMPCPTPQQIKNTGEPKVSIYVSRSYIPLK